MRLLLVRHGETVDNVAGIYAGVRDSPLTTHGVLQASRLASHLSSSKISHLFSSDLQRAFKTAESIRSAQSPAPAETTKLQLLREQDFGFYEGKSYLERQKGSEKNGKDIHRQSHSNDPGFQDVETSESMKARMDLFIDLHLVELLQTQEDDIVVVVVAHGIILSHLWRRILGRFKIGNISLASGVSAASERGLEHLGAWSNTGYLDLEIRESLVAINPNKSPVVSISTSLLKSSVAASEFSTNKLPTLSLVIKAVNSLEHLRGLKKTRGGIGSLKHDDKQQTMDSFFKKRRIE